MQKISSVTEDINNQKDVEVNSKGEIIEVKDNINKIIKVAIIIMKDKNH